MKIMQPQKMRDLIFSNLRSSRENRFVAKFVTLRRIYY